MEQVQFQLCIIKPPFFTNNNSQLYSQVIHLERPQRCYYNCSGIVCYCCLSCCLPHSIEVQAPPGTVVGYVKQDPCGILNPWFSIQNADEETVLMVKGPRCGCSCYSDAHFVVRFKFIFRTCSYNYNTIKQSILMKLHYLLNS